MIECETGKLVLVKVATILLCITWVARIDLLRASERLLPAPRRFYPLPPFWGYHLRR